MLNKLLPQLQKMGNKIRRYLPIIVFVLIGSMYAYLVFTSGKLAEDEPSDTQISEKYQGVNRPKIDKQAAEKLAELEDQNIEVKALFDEARDNPFSE